MTTLLLCVIYLAFIGLGLPDSLLGAAWPAMYGTLGVPVSMASVLNLLIGGGTVISSLLSVKLARRLGTGRLTLLSVGLTAAAMLGFSFSKSLWQLCLWSLPYGLGAGSVDAALNAFVALHFKSRHMSWLHSFWGIGATAGPYVMSRCLTAGMGWPSGYRLIGFFQTGLTLLLFLALPLWRRRSTGPASPSGADLPTPKSSLKAALGLPGLKTLLAAFPCHSALEATAGLWAGSYLALYKGLPADAAAKWAALFFLGITLARFLCGFLADKLGDRNMVRLGQACIAVGILLMLLPLGDGAAIGALFVIGLGCAPIYPSLLHETPVNFGAGNAQAVMGLQMAASYVGSAGLSAAFGFLAQGAGLFLYPFFLLALLLLMVFLVERAGRLCRRDA